MITAQKKNTVIVNNKHINGFSIIEVMIASLIFSLFLIGFMNIQKKLLDKHHYLKNKLQADQIAFQLLDSYPFVPQHIIPKGWEYSVQRQTYNNQCTLVKVIINTSQNNKSQQQRLFCN